MDIINYFESDRRAHWLKEIEACEWSAGKFLGELLREDKLKSATGQNTKLLLLIDGEKLLSFCTYAEADDIQPTDLTPWMGFVYTFPAYRGHRYLGLLLDEVCRIAREEGVAKFYLSTNHTGLYERFGCRFLGITDDLHGEPSRVYEKCTQLKS